jgi:hypothetical protein
VLSSNKKRSHAGQEVNAIKAAQDSISDIIKQNKQAIWPEQGVISSSC